MLLSYTISPGHSNADDVVALDEISGHTYVRFSYTLQGTARGLDA
jgi:hypothetical protein